MVRLRDMLVVLAIVLCGCTEAPELIAEGSDPKTPHEERVELLNDAIRRREPGVMQDLVGRAEALIATGDAADKAAAIDVLEALNKVPEKSAPPLTVRLADRDSPFLKSKAALDVLAKHRDSTVSGLAKERLRAKPF